MKLVVPGDSLGKDTEFTAGNGTYTLKDTIYASVVGVVSIVESDEKNTKVSASLPRTMAGWQLVRCHAVARWLTRPSSPWQREEGLLCPSLFMYTFLALCVLMTYLSCVRLCLENLVLES